MGFLTEQCPRCYSTKGFIRTKEYDKQTHLDGSNATQLYKKKQVPVCVNCGRWSNKVDIKKIFGY